MSGVFHILALIVRISLLCISFNLPSSTKIAYAKEHQSIVKIDSFIGEKQLHKVDEMISKLSEPSYGQENLSDGTKQVNYCYLRSISNPDKKCCSTLGSRILTAKLDLLHKIYLTFLNCECTLATPEEMRERIKKNFFTTDLQSFHSSALPIIYMHRNDEIDISEILSHFSEILEKLNDNTLEHPKKSATMNHEVESLLSLSYFIKKNNFTDKVHFTEKITKVYKVYLNDSRQFLKSPSNSSNMKILHNLATIYFNLQSDATSIYFEDSSIAILNGILNAFVDLLPQINLINLLYIAPIYKILLINRVPSFICDESLSLLRISDIAGREISGLSIYKISPSTQEYELKKIKDSTFYSHGNFKDWMKYSKELNFRIVLGDSSFKLTLNLDEKIIAEVLDMQIHKNSTNEHKSQENLMSVQETMREDYILYSDGYDSLIFTAKFVKKDTGETITPSSVDILMTLKSFKGPLIRGCCEGKVFKMKRNKNDVYKLKIPIKDFAIAAGSYSFELMAMNNHSRVNFHRVINKVDILSGKEEFTKIELPDSTVFQIFDKDNEFYPAPEIFPNINRRNQVNSTLIIIWTFLGCIFPFGTLIFVWSNFGLNFKLFRGAFIDWVFLLALLTEATIILLYFLVIDLIQFAKLMIPMSFIFLIVSKVAFRELRSRRQKLCTN